MEIFLKYNAIFSNAGLVILYFEMRKSQKNRVRKQIKIILITTLISYCLMPIIVYIFFPTLIVTALSIFIGGMWYTINKHKMMLISYELVSGYLFEAVNKPIIILGEDCNNIDLSIIF
ncbi:hypothetical protein LGK95_19185 [Clostridium algoriphilum]|uniref:hypothetical protein n=1 Tax=Clostridium algoriphilum TaxID=198347 RepID=UPI001CF3CF6A|nr:hypothetical protein [Clostridium algoriphilum]MCB2295606.1 hypothetical protein [Clostridium algoriphilum]